MSVCIALSDVFGPDAQKLEVKIDEIEGPKKPIYVAVLYALIYPALGAVSIVILIQYAGKTLRLSSNDYA